MPLDLMQHFGSPISTKEKVERFIKEVCKLEPKDIDFNQQVIAFDTWSRSLYYEKEETPLEFELDGKTFKSCYIELVDRKIEDPLSMQLAFLYESANLDFDLDTYRDIDNITALMYREDWSKPFNQIEYFNNAIFFNKQPLKFSLFGVDMYQNLIVTLKQTYPILYQDEESSVKSDGRRMFDLLNAVSGDSPIKQDDARNTKISNAFTWLEQKKIDSINERLKNGNK